MSRACMHEPMTNPHISSHAHTTPLRASVCADLVVDDDPAIILGVMLRHLLDGELLRHDDREWIG